MPQVAIFRLNAALLGRYRIERQLGEGGMATVYLARDEKHNRNVALKVLKPELAAVVGADRFLAEIQTTANLQHPHILPLFDSGEAGGFLFYVMPFVEGESLREKLDREHQLPVDEAVRIGTNVAEALEYAHSHGVIHRDIKPANILIQAGKPVVSDFGIALAVGMAGGGRLTETGLSLGTPHYMSPEQATGDQTVGVATDIYALGCVLYEMLVGDPPYIGSTAQAILGKIVTGDADPVTKHRRAVPANVDAAIRKALEKLPADRFRSAGEFARALGDAGFRVEGVAAAGVAAGGARNGRVAAGVALGLALGLAAAFSYSRLTSEDAPAEVIRFSIPLADSVPIDIAGNGHELAISPDGRLIAYQSNDPLHIRLRPLDQLESAAIRGTEGGYGPVFSPDGQEIVFAPAPNGLQLMKVSVLGGPPLTLVSEAGGAIWGASWGDDDWIVYGTNVAGLYRVRAGGGEPEELTAPDPSQDEVGHVWPSIIPGRDAVLFAIRRAGGAPLVTAQLAVLDLVTGGVKRLGIAGTGPRYLSTGHVAYAVEDGTVRGVPFDVDALEVTGSPVPLLEDIVVESSGAVAYDVSRQGRLVYARGSLVTEEGSLVWVDRLGREEPLSAPPAAYSYPRISPDGGRVALDVRGEDGGIWIWDFAAETPTRLVLGEGSFQYPVWTRDGSHIAYDDLSGDIRWKAANNTGSTELLVEAAGSEGTSSPSPYFFTWDGSALVFRDQANPETGDDLAMLLFDDDSVVWRLNGDFAERNAELSPDGAFMAYESYESGTAEIYVRPFPDVEANQVRVSNNTGHYPLWSRDGRELFYLEEGTPPRIMSVSFNANAATGSFVVRGRSVVMEWSYYAGAEGRTYDVSPDGQRFLVVKVGSAEDEATPNAITVVQNWFEVVRDRMGN